MAQHKWVQAESAGPGYGVSGQGLVTLCESCGETQNAHARTICKNPASSVGANWRCWFCTDEIEFPAVREAITQQIVCTNCTVGVGSKLKYPAAGQILLPLPVFSGTQPSGAVVHYASSLYGPSSSWSNPDVDPESDPSPELYDGPPLCTECSTQLSSYLDAYYGPPDSPMADMCSPCREGHRIQGAVQ